MSFGGLQAQAPVITATKDDGVPAATKVPAGSTVTYTNVIGNSGAATATGVTFTDPDVTNTTFVNGSIHISPLAINDSYQTLANTRLRVGGTTSGVEIFVNSNVYANDVQLNGPGGTDTSVFVTNSASANGTVSFNSGTGSFTFDPTPGFVGTATFTYTIRNSADNTLTDTGTVSIQVLDTNPVVGGNQSIWYVQNSAAAGGLGRSADPFDTLAEAQAASAAGDTIYVFTGSGTTTGQNAGIVLQDSQRLIGEGVALTVPVSVNGGPNPLTLRAAGSAPSISNSASHCVTALNRSSIEIRGFNISTTGAGNNGVDIQTTGASNGSAEVANNTITGAGGNGIDFNGASTGTLNASVHDNTVTATGNGIEIQRGAGSLNVTAFDDNFVTGDTGGNGIFLTTVNFDATPGGSYQTVNCGNTAIGISGNPVGGGGFLASTLGGDVSFSDLDIYTSNGSALSVTGSGVVNTGAGTGTRVTVTSGNGTFVATGGAAVDMTSCTIDIQSALITSTNSAGNGVNLNGTSNGSTNSTFSAIASSSITTASGAAFNCGSNNANVTYNGTITDDLGTLVSVSACTGGTKSFTGAITDGNDGDGNGISLSSNAGATIDFTGGITLSTGANAAFTATGGGTVTVTDPAGSDNTIVTTSGTALNVANTTIGASGLTFRSISANGAANGIVLNNTGASAGLTVTGDAGSTNNGTGGTIQSTTGAGILLTNTRNVSFDQLNLTNTGGAGVQGTQVTNFTHTNSTFTSPGDAFNESGISFNDSDNVNTGVGDTGQGLGNNINGTLTVTGNTFTSPTYSGIDVQCDNGQIDNAVITGNTISNPGFAGVNFVGIGNTTTVARLMRANISNNTITLAADGIQVAYSNGSASGPGAVAGTVAIDGSGRPVADGTNVISITSNAISVTDTGTHAINVANGGGNAGNRTQTNFIIQNNGTSGAPLLGSDIGTVILIGNNGFSDMAGVVNNNFLDANHTPGDAGGGGNGIAGGNGVSGAGNAWTPRLSLTVTNNTLNDHNGNGILLVGRSTSGEAYIKIANNNVGVPNNTGGSARPGIRVDAGNSSSADDAIYLNIFGNTSAGSNGAEGIGVRKEGAVATTNDFGIFDAAGGPSLVSNPSNAQVEAFIEALNPSGGGAFVINGSAFTLDTTLAPPLLFAPAEVSAAGMAEPDSVASAVVWTEAIRSQKSEVGSQRSEVGSDAGVIGQQSTVGASPEATQQRATPQFGTLTQAELDGMVAAARERWVASGLSEEQKELLANLRFEVAELPGWYLGEAGGSTIRVDADAGGNGWFVDVTPGDDEEFVGDGTRLMAAGRNLQSTNYKAQDEGARSAERGMMGFASSQAEACTPTDRVDLLTTILHEMGHAMGLCDGYSRLQRNSVMYGFLTKGERRLPMKGEAANAVPHVHAQPHHLGSPIVIGDLPSGKSVTIKYSVTVNDALTWNGATQLSSHGTVTGSNFTNVNGSASTPNTNDPETGAAKDATITLLDRPDATVAITRAGTTPTNATSVTWTATFSTGVKDVGTSNFVLAPAGGVTGAGITGVVAVGPGSGSPTTWTSWTVTANTGSNDGTLGLNLANDTGVSHEITNAPATGEVYTIDKTPPTVAMTSAAANPTNVSPIAVTAQFSEPVLNFVSGDIVPGNATVQNFVAVDGDTYTFNLVPSGQGLVTADIAAGVANDAATNGNTVAVQFTRTFDTVQPTVAMSSATGDPAVNAPIPVTVQFSEPVLNFVLGDIVVTNATTNTFVAVDGDTYTFNLVPSGPGVTVTANIAAGVANDAATNQNTAAPQFSRVIVDQVSIAATTATAVEGGATGLYTLTRGNTTASMVANFQLDGTSTATASGATPDFTLTSAQTFTFNTGTGAGTINFPAGTASVTITLTAGTEAPVSGGQSAEGAETARLNVVAVAGVYVPASPPNDNATVTITENGFVVTNTNNAGQGSLRQAVLNANAIAGTDTIIFGNGAGGTTNFTDATPETILLTTGQLIITANANVSGPGANLLTVSNGAGAGTDNRIFRTGTGVNAVLRGMTISGGNASVLAGGIVADGGAGSFLTVIHCTVSGNSSSNTGGIYAGAGNTLTVANSTISGNSATSAGALAGGIQFQGLAMIAVNSTISGNSVASSGVVQSAGGLLVSTGSASIRNVTIADNVVTGTTAGASGVRISVGTTASAGNSIIAGNQNSGTVPEVINAGTLTSMGGNVVGNPGSFLGFTGTGDKTGAAATPLNLGALTNNGGTTSTHALLSGSVALNNGQASNLPPDVADVDGDNDFAETLPVDQRGVGFNRSIGNPDAGAFELQKSVGIVALDATKAEGTGAGLTAFTFTVARTGDTTGPVTVNYAVTGTGGTPANGTDFQGGTLPNGSVTIADTLASTTLTINVAQDGTVEPNEGFTVTLSNPDNGYVVNGATATGTINNDDATTVTLAGGVAQNEGNAGTTSYSFTVTSSNPVQGGFTIAYATNNGTATTADLDYIDNDGTLTFTSTSAGEVQNVTVLVNGDNKVEANEAFTVALGAVTGTSLGASITPAGTPQTGTITNDDSAVVALTGNVSQAEALTPQVFTVTLSNSVDVPVTVQFSTSDDTALVADNDYTGITNQVVTFAAGTTTAQTVNVAVTSDGNFENNEVFNVALGGLNASGRAVTLGTSTRTGTILNDDFLTVNILPSDPSADENTADTGTYLITRNSILNTTTVQLQIDSGSTAADADYALSGGSETFANEAPGAFGSVVIPPGQSSVTVTLTPVDDLPAEGPETSRLNILANAAYTLGANLNATVTIVANDSVVTNTNDIGEGSLRQAAENANNIAGVEIVTFEGSVFTDATPDVISLTSGEIPVGLFTEINGTGARMLTVANTAAPSATSRVFHITGSALGTFLRDMTITGGNPNNNGGGGVFVDLGASVTIERCTITANTPLGRGAGIRIASAGAATVIDSTISNNTSAGTNCGAGIDVAAGTLIVTNSTISGNSVTAPGASGGGIFTAGASTIQISNCTITNNSATGTGSAGGVKQTGASVNMISSIVAKNVVTGSTSPDVAGTFLTPSYNLIGNNTGSNFTAGTPNGTNWVGSSGVTPFPPPLDPLLGPLADNGGPTNTHMLLNGSPALDRGTNSLALTFDQRGPVFPRLIGVGFDIGSIEALIFTPSITTVTTNEDTLSASGPGLVITKNVADNNLTTHYKITSFVNGTVFKSDATPIPSGGFITLAEGALGLRFFPDPNENSGNTPAGFHFNVQASTSATDAGLKPEVVTANITVTPVNDPPTVVPPGIPDQSIVVLQTISVPLLPHFQDVDLNTLSFTVFSNTPVGVVGSGMNGSNVVLLGLSPGTAQITIRADDGNGGSIMDTFSVLVGVPKLSPSISANRVLNAQTGLFEMKVDVSNTTPVNLFGFRLRVTNLPTSLKLHNATSPIGSPDVFVEHAYPLAVGDKVTLTLQFYSPTRTWPPGYVPTFDVEGITNPMDTAVSPTGVPITRLVEQADGSILIEWAAVVGKWYQVQFSDDNVSWKRSLVLVKAGATRVQWIDKGPPFTDVHPSLVANRFYRVVKIVP